MQKILIVISLSLFSLTAFGIDLDTKCFSIVDELDRDYCHKKKMRLLNKELEADRGAWPKTLSVAVKEKKQSSLRLKLSQKKSELAMLRDEVKIYEHHQRSLGSAKTVKVKKKKKKKKKRKRSDIERALNIRL